MPLLSTVMGMELMARAAGARLPGHRVQQIEDLVVLPPVLFPNDEPVEVRVEIDGEEAGEEGVAGGQDRARCRLTTGDGTAHYQAVVVRGAGYPPGPADRVLPVRRGGDPTVGAAAVYGLYFHGPSFRVVADATFSDGVMVGRLALTSGLPPGRAAETAMAPLLVELCMQTAGLWELASSGRMMIPDGIDRVVRYRPTEADGAVGLRALVTRRVDADTGPEFDAEVVDDSGAVHLRVEGYRTVELSEPMDSRAAVPILAALGPLPPSS